MDMTQAQRLIGRWLGIAHQIGSNMTYWVLTKNGKVIAHSTVQHITTTDMAQPAIQDLVRVFDTAVSQHLADMNFWQVEPGVFYLDDEPGDDAIAADNMNMPTDEEYGNMITPPGPDVDDVETHDKYLNAEFIVNHGYGDSIKARVDTHVEQYPANIIAENIYSQCDTEGRSLKVLNKIVDHKWDNLVITVADGYDNNNIVCCFETESVVGWLLLVALCSVEHRGLDVIVSISFPFSCSHSV
jgi:hypothetical protein